MHEGGRQDEKSRPNDLNQDPNEKLTDTAQIVQDKT